MSTLACRSERYPPLFVPSLLILLISLTSFAIPVYAVSSSAQNVTTSGPSTRGVPAPNSLSVMQDANVTGEALGLGWLPEDVPADARVTPVYAAALPTHFDWSNWMTSVKNQGGCGSCVGFAAVGATEAQYRIAANSPGWDVDLSEQHLFSCGGGQCGYGWYISAALNRLRDYGTPDEACFPYTAQDRSCSGGCADWQSRAFKIASWSWVANNPNAVEAALMNGPLVAGFTVYSDFFGYHGGVYHWDHVSQAVGGHAIVIVGYDSNEQYWIVKNSWGSGWGENGYFRIGFREAGIENYVASIRASISPTTYTVTFNTDPSTGTIVADGETKTDGSAGTYGASQRVHVVANPPSGYSFSSWESSGVTFDDQSSKDTYMTVSADGWLKVHFALGSPPVFHSVIRGTDNGIRYGSLGQTVLPGSTPDSPAAAACGGALHVAVRGSDNGIYYGYVTLSTNVFSGWGRVPGSTPSAPALAAAPDCTLYLLVRGSDNGIYLNTLPNGGAWSGWQKLPGATTDSPAMTVAGPALHIVVRGGDGSSIWHGMMDRNNGQWLGWSRLSGSTPSKMALAAASETEVYLVVRGSDSRIYVNKWDGTTWTGWNYIPTGNTPSGPSATIAESQLYVAVRGMDNGIYWCGRGLPSGLWSSWTKLPGSTTSPPALA